MQVGCYTYLLLSTQASVICMCSGCHLNVNQQPWNEAQNKKFLPSIQGSKPVLRQSIDCKCFSHLELLSSNTLNSNAAMVCASGLKVIVLKYGSLLNSYIPNRIFISTIKFSSSLCQCKTCSNKKGSPFSFSSCWESPYGSIYKYSLAKDFDIWLKEQNPSPVWVQASQSSLPATFKLKLVSKTCYIDWSMEPHCLTDAFYFPQHPLSGALPVALGGSHSSIDFWLPKGKIPAPCGISPPCSAVELQGKQISTSTVFMLSSMETPSQWVS